MEMVDPHMGIGPLPFGSAEANGHGFREAQIRRWWIWRCGHCAPGAARSGWTTRQWRDLPPAISLRTGSPCHSTSLSSSLRRRERRSTRVSTNSSSAPPSEARRLGGCWAASLISCPDAPQALAQVAAAEAERSPGWVVAELVYQPRTRRLGNVSTRPNLRRYEIPIDLPSSTDADHTIGVDELVVGVRDGRFQLRWTRTGEVVMVTAGHMLTSTRAPATARFLSEVGRHRTRQLGAFSWGPAASFPFLPRVRCGRIVLSLAQWRLRADSFSSGLDDPRSFRTELDAWRARWDAPAALVVAAGDHRLPLDLTRAGDADELRRTLRSRGSVVVQERFPHSDRTWLTDTAGRRFAAEFVVPLIRRSPIASAACHSDGGQRHRPQAARQRLVVRQAVLPFRCGDRVAQRVRSAPLRVRRLVRASPTGSSSDTAIRARHIRLRFRGEPARLLSDLLPRVTAWATDLISSGMCQQILDRHLRSRTGSLRRATRPRGRGGLLLRRQRCRQRPVGILRDRATADGRHDSRRDTERIRLEPGSNGRCGVRRDPGRGVNPAPTTASGNSSCGRCLPASAHRNPPTLCWPGSARRPLACAALRPNCTTWDVCHALRPTCMAASCTSISTD